MTLRWMYDASTPPKNPPHWHVVGGYIGGNTPHVWTQTEWDDQWAPFRLPIFTCNNRADEAAMAQADNGIIRRALENLGVPEGVVVCADTETRVYTTYLSTLNRLLYPYHLLNYGSLFYVRENPHTSAGRWVADWTDDIYDGIDLLNQDRFTAVQYASDAQTGRPFDESVIIESLPLWPR